jgi:hypothetical protein
MSDSDERKERIEKFKTDPRYGDVQAVVEDIVEDFVTRKQKETQEKKNKEMSIWDKLFSGVGGDNE